MHMGFIGVSSGRYWMQDGGYLPKNGLPPAVYLAETCFQEIHKFCHISPDSFPT